MSYLGNTSHGQSPLNFGGGGMGGVVMPLAAIGLAGLAAWDLLATSVLLAAATGAYVALVVVLLFALSRNWAIHESTIRFFLITSVFVAALTVFGFRGGFIRFAVGDALIMLLLIGALLAGLWKVLSWPLRAVTVAAIAVLIAAPLSEDVQRNEKWLLNVRVRDESCGHVRNADVKCQVISDATGEILDEGGPQQTSEYGWTSFIFDGNPWGKKARCEASKAEQGSGTAIADPTWIFAAEARIRLSPSGQTIQPCSNDD